MDFKRISIKIIKDYQHDSGAYVASPNFENYKYCWLRDGSFIAYSMDKVGEHESARRFYEWVNGVILGQQDRLKRLFKKHKKKKQLNADDFLPCRYTLEGQVTNDDWPNFQLDGYGTWLWGISEHVKATGNLDLLEHFKASIASTIQYLTAFWHYPNSDCWEENPDEIHSSTLACISGGLKAINSFVQNEEIESVIKDINDFILKHAVKDERFVKHLGTGEVDASLLWLALPFEVIPVGHPYMKKTIEKIESDILFEGGVRRYSGDTYYGGGEWLLLSSWLGWYYAESGRDKEALRQLEWVESSAKANGWMPEQTLDHVNDPAYIPKWTQLWGGVANPLLWSHAMYLILHEELTGKKIDEPSLQSKSRR